MARVGVEHPTCQSLVARSHVNFSLKPSWWVPLSSYSISDSGIPACIVKSLYLLGQRATTPPCAKRRPLTCRPFSPVLFGQGIRNKHVLPKTKTNHQKKFLKRLDSRSWLHCQIPSRESLTPILQSLNFYPQT